MAQKKWLIVLGFINVLLIAAIVFWYINRDNTPPVITQENEIVYDTTMSDSELLMGAVAFDETDQDVSHTLVVEKVIVNQTTGVAMVTYGAMDRSGNIAKQTFRMEMAEVEDEASENVFTLAVGEAANGTETAETSESDSDETEENTSEEDSEVTDTEEGEDAEAGDEDAESEDADAESDEESEDDEEAEAEEEERAREEAARQRARNPQPSPETPVLNFGATEITTKKGYNPAWVTVISQLQDDKDNYETLLGNLRINGEFTNATIGSYDVTVSTVDSDGNESAARAIRIIVVE